MIGFPRRTDARRNLVDEIEIDAHTEVAPPVAQVYTRVRLRQADGSYKTFLDRVSIGDHIDLIDNLGVYVTLDISNVPFPGEPGAIPTRREDMK